MPLVSMAGSNQLGLVWWWSTNSPAKLSALLRPRRRKEEMKNQGEKMWLGTISHDSCLDPMSVFGGDSWAREAQHRKRRVDDLLLDGIDASSYKKLSNGKFACLICPKNPIFDTLIMLSAHVKGSCHRTAEIRCRDRELARKEEINKRIALSDSRNPNSGVCASIKRPIRTNKPLIERVQKVASEVYSSGVGTSSRTCGNPVSESEAWNHAVQERAVGKVQQSDHREHREKELKFTAAGWKRDCHGSWFKDENVEFDSDEEDPNIVLTDTT